MVTWNLKNTSVCTKQIAIQLLWKVDIDWFHTKSYVPFPGTWYSLVLDTWCF